MFSILQAFQVIHHFFFLKEVSDTPLKILLKGKPETGIEGLWQ